MPFTLLVDILRQCRPITCSWSWIFPTPSTLYVNMTCFRRFLLLLFLSLTLHHLHANRNDCYLFFCPSLSHYLILLPFFYSDKYANDISKSRCFELKALDVMQSLNWGSCISFVWHSIAIKIVLLCIIPRVSYFVMLYMFTIYIYS